MIEILFLISASCNTVSLLFCYQRVRFRTSTKSHQCHFIYTPSNDLSSFSFTGHPERHFSDVFIRDKDTSAFRTPESREPTSEVFKYLFDIWNIRMRILPNVSVILKQLLWVAPENYNIHMITYSIYWVVHLV